VSERDVTGRIDTEILTAERWGAASVAVVVSVGQAVIREDVALAVS